MRGVDTPHIIEWHCEPSADPRLHFRAKTMYPSAFACLQVRHNVQDVDVLHVFADFADADAWWRDLPRHPYIVAVGVLR